MHNRRYYLINSRSLVNGEHVIHRNDCPLLPGPGSRFLLGSFNSPSDAREEGLKHFEKVKCCPFCMNETHSIHNIRKTAEHVFPEACSSFDHIKALPDSGLMCCIS
jgi:hypothetical protein